MSPSKKIESFPTETLPTEGTWVRFLLESKSSKTSHWRVISKVDKGHIAILLGDVRWFGRWRKYAFFPNSGNNLVFEETCLTDIADFIQLATKLHRQAKKTKSKPTSK